MKSYTRCDMSGTTRSSAKIADANIAACRKVPLCSQRMYT